MLRFVFSFCATVFIATSASLLSADTILVDNDFESGTLESWTASGNSGLYMYDGVGTNYATSGIYALDETKSSSSFITLADSLLLDSQGYTSVTVSFDWTFLNGSSTRRTKLQYTSDGVNWVDLLQFNTGFAGAPPTSGTEMFTLNEGTYAFTDDAKFRFALADNGGADIRARIDNVLITGSPEFVATPVPEPASLAAWGLLAVGLVTLRRRRKSR